MTTHRCSLIVTLGAALLFSNFVQSVHPQGLSAFDRDNARAMLDAIKDDLKKNYYDPTLRGMDMTSRFAQAEERLKQATSRDQLIVTVAQVMLELNDSHTFFLPPTRAASVEYGWQMQMIGDAAYITAVKPKSDAEAKGLRPGDAVLTVDGYRPGRENLWKMYYRYYGLMPARSVRLVVQPPGEPQAHEVEIVAKIQRRADVADWEDLYVRGLREEWDIYHDQFHEVGEDLLIWKLPTFAVEESHIDAIMKRAQKFRNLIIDLRGNGGGYQDTLSRLVGYFFDRDIKIGELRGRKEMKPILAKSRAGAMFKGKLIVLVDSDSASAAELFSRVIQLENRGTVLGDRTAGAVMTAKHYLHQSGVGTILYFGTSVTIADVVMSDGKSLEKAGVVPDELLLVTGTDLAAQRDPVLTRAAKLAGVELDPKQAGSLFPKEWRN